MGSSSDQLFKDFLSAIEGADDERLHRFFRLIMRDRFGVERFDDEIKVQLECGNYGPFGRSLWEFFKETRTVPPPRARNDERASGIA